MLEREKENTPMSAKEADRKKKKKNPLEADLVAGSRKI